MRGEDACREWAAECRVQPGEQKARRRAYESAVLATEMATAPPTVSSKRWLAPTPAAVLHSIRP